MKAFPTKVTKLHIDKCGEHEQVEHDEGMDLRDYFAAKVMEAFLSNTITFEAYANTTGVAGFQKDFYKSCYQIADAMMEARSETNR